MSERWKTTFRLGNKKRFVWTAKRNWNAALVQKLCKLNFTTTRCSVRVSDLFTSSSAFLISWTFLNLSSQSPPQLFWVEHWSKRVRSRWDWTARRLEFQEADTWFPHGAVTDWFS